MKRIQKLKAKSGFTLVECVIAIMVFSILAAVVVTLLNAAITTHISNMSETRSLRAQRTLISRGDGEKRNHGSDPTLPFAFTCVPPLPAGHSAADCNSCKTATISYELAAGVANQDEVFSQAEVGRIGLELTEFTTEDPNTPRATNTPAFTISFFEDYHQRGLLSVGIGPPDGARFGFNEPASGATQLQGEGWCHLGYAYSVPSDLDTIGFGPSAPAATAGADAVAYPLRILFTSGSPTMLPTGETHTMSLNIVATSAASIRGVIASCTGSCTINQCDHVTLTYTDENGNVVSTPEEADFFTLTITASPGNDFKMEYDIAFITKERISMKDTPCEGKIIAKVPELDADGNPIVDDNGIPKMIDDPAGPKNVDCPPCIAAVSASETPVVDNPLRWMGLLR